MTETAAADELDDSAARPRAGWAWRCAEALVLFLIGVLWMSFFYSGRNVPITDIGVPGNDSGYHVKMAALLPELGFAGEFPWLKFAYFRNSGDEFVSHHAGFHVLLLPFVQASYWLTGDYLTGGRWAICTCFGLLLVAFNALLAAGNVRWRWFWIALILLLPNHFFMRHANVRAITPALLLMLLIVLAMFRERWFLAGLAVMAFNLLYLGAVMFSPVIVIAFVAASMFGPAGDRRFPWKIVFGTLAGWVLGVVLYPYSAGMWEFLRLQVFGSGLNPDIRVGTEWYPYDDVWKFVTHQAGPTLLIWMAALTVRLRSGPPLDARALSLVIMTVAFLVLTLKAQRFIEYWPLVSLLSSAYLAAPPLARLAEWFDGRHGESAGRAARCGWRGLVGVGLGVAIVLQVLIWFSPGLVKWVEQSALEDGAAREVALRVLRNFAGRMTPLIDDWQLFAMAGLFVVGAAGGVWRASRSLRTPARLRCVAVTVVFSGTLWAGTLCLAGENLQRIQNATRCGYDLKAIREMMKYIQDHSQRGDVIFTDDWDTFPIFFYHNSFNHFIVGLDPKFTQERRPDLWERYCRITQARVPGNAVVKMPGAGGKRVDEAVHVELRDIRDVFGARWVICDRDHRGLAGLLNQDKDLAELVYPSKSYSRASGATYMVFRIRDAGEAPASRPEDGAGARAAPQADANGILFLGRLEPLVIEQGWGEFSVDRSVEGGPLMVGGTRFLNGLGTHAPARIEYEIPDGFERFEATVGVDSSQAPDGSIVAVVEVDGREVFRSVRLTSEKPGANVAVSVRGAKRLVLLAETTEDGPRSDHVNWAGARLVRPVGD